MNSVSAIYVLGCNQHEGEEDSTIELNTCIIGHLSGPMRKSFWFALDEFIDEDECRNKEALNYFLIESGVDDDRTQTIMMKLVLSAAEARGKLDPGFRGALTLSLVIYVRSVQHNPRTHEGPVRSGAEIRFRPASRLAIASLSRKRFKKQSRRGDEYRCNICLEDLAPGAKLASLPCVHEFHDECIVEWLETSHVCPLCRFELPCEPEPEPVTTINPETQIHI